MGKTIKRICNIVSTAAVVVILILALALVGVRLAGFQLYAVLSGSMMPSYPVGSLLYDRKVDPAELEAGDAITYTVKGGYVVTHRIVEIVSDSSGVSFRTKGDANEEADASLVRQVNVLGKPYFCVPYLGYISVWLETGADRLTLAAVVLMLLLLSLLPELFSAWQNKQ